MTTNPAKLPHFNPQSFPREKAPGTYRIFSVGGSTAYGHPWTDPVSFSGWLRGLLPEADPGRKWEVINAGGISYASYREAKLLEELAAYQPDLFLVYSGHNEFLEERTYRKAARIPGLLRETGALLDRTRTYTALRLLLRKLRFRDADQVKPGSSQSFRMAGEVDDVLAKTIGPTSYVRDDALKQRVLEHYRFSLARMIRIAHAAGAEVLFLTTPANEKDCSPFKSAPGPGLDSNARDAGFLYRAGQAAFAAGNFPEAKGFFQKAIEEDICPLRALPVMRGIVREVAEAGHAPWIDFAGILEQETRKRSGNDVLGEPDFVDHVHLTMEDYRLMALSILDKMAAMGAVHPRPGWREEGVRKVTERVMAKVDDKMRGLGLHNIAKVLNWAGKHEDAVRVAERALQVDSNDLEAIWSSLYVGTSRERHGKEAEAISHYRRAVRLDPNFALARRYLAGALARNGENGEAVAQYDSVLQLDPDDLEAREGIAKLLLRLGRLPEAVAHLSAAVARMPDRTDLSTMLGIALFQSGRMDEAYASFASTLRRNPRDAWALVGLGHIVENRGDKAAAIGFFSRALTIDPDIQEARQALSRNLGQMPEVR